MTEFEVQSQFDVNSIDWLSLATNTANTVEPTIESFFTQDVLGQQFTSEHSSPAQLGLGSPNSEDHSSINERSDSSSDEMESLPSFSFPSQPQILQDVSFEFPAISQIQNTTFQFPEVIDANISTPPNSSKDDDGKGTKRRRKPTDSNQQKVVDMTEAQLLEFDSKQMEEYMQSLTANRTLAPSEEKHLKKIRRLIKNREYAQSSRDKKKQMLDELQKQLNQAKQELAAVQTRNQQLESENTSLRAQMAKVSLLLRTDPVIRERLAARAKPTPPKPSSVDPSATTSNIEVSMPSSESIADSSIPQSPSSSFWNIGLPSASTVVSGFSLFIILFSFALFFGGSPQTLGGPSNLAGPTLPGAKLYNTGRSLLEAAQIFAFGTEIEKKNWLDSMPISFKDFLIRNNLYVTPHVDESLMDPLLEQLLTAEDSAICAPKSVAQLFADCCPVPNTTKQQ